MFARLVPYVIAMWELHQSQPLERDPWPAAEAEVFSAARAWAGTQTPQEAVAECSAICERLNKVPGAGFVSFCENGREMANIVGMYLSQIKGEVINRSDILAELDRLELSYIEDSVVSEMGDMED